MGDTSGFKAMLERVVVKSGTAAYQACLEGAREIGGTMKNAVPRDSGNLAASIRIETNEGRGRVYIKAGGPLTTKPVRSGVTATYDYALGVELGTQRNAAQPFFWPKWRAGKKKAQSRINRVLKRTIEEESAK